MRRKQQQNELKQESDDDPHNLVRSRSGLGRAAIFFFFFLFFSFSSYLFLSRKLGLFQPCGHLRATTTTQLLCVSLTNFSTIVVLSTTSSSAFSRKKKHQRARARVSIRPNTFCIPLPYFFSSSSMSSLFPFFLLFSFSFDVF